MRPEVTPDLPTVAAIVAGTILLFLVAILLAKWQSKAQIHTKFERSHFGGYKG